MFVKMLKTNGEPYTRRLVRTVRGQVLGNLPSQDGKAPGAEPTIYNYLNCKKPFSRLWINSMTDSAITAGFNNLKDGAVYDNLYLTAEARSKADWLMGINASRALCIASSEGNNSLGRVQTPTLSMICNRYLDLKNFRAQPFWQPVITLEKDDIFFHVNAVETYFDEEKANNIYNHLNTYPLAKVERIRDEDKRIQPPLLHDLASLQKEANQKWGFTAEKTLDTAQKLYEKKFISYPRTGCRHIPGDVFEQIPSLIELLREYPDLYNQAKILSAIKLNQNCVNDKKITDHHALIITEVKAVNLNSNEKTIYELIAGRMLESFAGVCIKSTRNIDISCDDIKFNLKQSAILDKGWTSLFGVIPEDEECDDTVLPAFTEGDYLKIASCSLNRKKTKPKPLFTDSSLLTAMENAGKEIEDEEYRKAIKECGIGTPATRAAILETLLNRGYIERDKKNIVPTSKGLQLHNIIKSMRIADVEMTAGWEKALSKIEKTPDFYPTFISGIQIHAKQAVDEIISVVKSDMMSIETPHICPRCRLGKITIYKKVAKCGYSKCNLTFFREVCGKSLTDNQINELFKTGKSPLIKGLKNKEGKSFDAYIVIDNNGNFHFEYPKKKK